MKVLIADQNLQHSEILSTYLCQYFPEVSGSIIISRKADLNRAIAKEIPAVLFLCLDMLQKDAYRIIEEARNKSITSGIIMSSEPKYHSEAIIYGACDFIEKPIEYSGLERAMARAVAANALHERLQKQEAFIEHLSFVENELSEELRRERTKLLEYEDHEMSDDTIPAHKNYILIKDGKKRKKILANEILLCRSEQSYTYIHLANGEIFTSSQPLIQYERELVTCGFMRVHKSYLINISKVQHYESDPTGNTGGVAIFTNAVTASIARDKKQGFMRDWQLNV